MRIDKFLRLASGWLPGVDYFKEIIRRIFAKSHYQVLFALFLAVFTISCGNGQSSQKLEAMQKNVNVVTMDNSEPRRDVESKIIDAHDGCLQLFGSSTGIRRWGSKPWDRLSRLVMIHLSGEVLPSWNS